MPRGETTKLAPVTASIVERAFATPADRATENDLVGLDLSAAAPIGWKVTLVCGLVAFLETLAVGMVGGALTNIQETFDLSNSLAGAIPTAAILGSLAVALPSARLADVGRRTRVLGTIAVLWTIVAVGSAWAPIFALFLFSRVLLGASAQLNNPAASSMIADAHPARGRAKAYGYERMANYLGLPVGIALGAALADGLGWRTAFTIGAIPGLVAAAAAFSVTDPPRGLGDLLDRARRNGADTGDTGDTDDTGEARMASAGAASFESSTPAANTSDVAGTELVQLRPPTLTQLRSLWTVNSLRAVLIGLPVLFSALGALFFWATKYFEQVHGLDEKGAGGIAGGVGGTGIVIGIILGSRFGDRFHGVRPGWRLALGSAGMLAGAAAFALMLSLPTLAVQATMFGLTNIGIAIAIPNLTAAVADVVPAANRGSAFSALQFLLAGGSALGPPLVGVASDLIGTLRPAMMVLLIPMAIAGLVVRSGRSSFDGDVDAVLAAV